MEVEQSIRLNMEKLKAKEKDKKTIIFNGRFKVKAKLAKGSFGQCFEAVDILDNDKSVICKINDEKEMNEIEGNVLIKLNEKGFTNFPKLLGIGVRYRRPY